MIALSDLANGAKRLADLSKRIEQADLKEEALSLREVLQEAREVMLQLREENSELRAEIQELKAIQSRRDELVEMCGLLYDRDASGQATGIPYCPTCIELGQGFFRISKRSTSWTSRGCPNCDTNFPDARFLEPSG